MSEPDPVTEALGMLDPDVWEIWSAPGILRVSRVWTDDTLDTLIVLSSETAYGRRDHRTNGLVWHCRGSVLTVVSALAALPAPGEPGAPSEPLTDRTDDLT